MDVRLEQSDVRAAVDGRLLYRETHYVLPGRTPERWVLYRCPDGRPFARKHVQAKTRAAAPDFAFEDGRDGYREGVRSDGGSRAVFVGDRGKNTSSPLAVPDNGVIDAGFDAAVQSHWPELVRGGSVRLQFLIPSRKRFFPVRVRRIDSMDWHGVRAERLRMTLDTWFGFAVPDVTLVYAREGRRLLEFNGTGNVRDARGHNPQVRIAFAKPPVDAPPGELSMIQRVPLAGRCKF